MIDSVVDLLRCPLCTLPVTVAEQTVRCSAGHSFDIARQGYVNLLPRPPKGANADTGDMVAARERFLSAGHYRGLADRLAEQAALSLSLSESSPENSPDDLPGGPVVLEPGAGTGYYLGRVINAVKGSRGIATDLSAAACRRAARVDDQLGVVVADTWAGLPIMDAAVDLIIVVFAPRNPSEFARLLRPGGWLVIAAANDDHLAELRGPLGMIDVQPGKLRTLETSLREWFDLQHSESLRSQLSLNHTTLRDLVLMGPTAHHRRADLAGRIAMLPDPASVTLSVGLSIFRRH